MARAELGPAPNAGTLLFLIPGKLFMKKIYLMTAVTMVVAVASCPRCGPLKRSARQAQICGNDCIPGQANCPAAFGGWSMIG